MSGNIREITFPSHTKECEIFARIYYPKGTPKGILQLAHGMAEHIDRYDEFAKTLCAQGYLFAANDHAGHGRSLKDDAHKGYFAAEDGWTAVVEDLRELRAVLKAEYPELPYILMGHSMGSFLARTYAARYPDEMDALIISGTSGKNPVLGIAKWLASREIKKHGAMTPSLLLNKLAFGSYNKQFKPERTGFEWLTTVDSIVDAYVADPLCGFPFTAAGFRDLFNGLGEVSEPSWAGKVPNVPILIFSGDQDPVGANGKGVKEVADALVKSGHAVTLKLYPGCRHEMLNESCKEEVSEDILAFLGSVVNL
ncbi:MAG: lysophospholipase [Clostridia bacterium]|nr:lysophospholipase [Clostridia bacterium]